MKRRIWIILLIILSLACFTLSYFYIASPNSVTKPEIVVNSAPTNGFVTWYTSIPQIFAERIANAFTIETGIDVKIIRNSTFIIREKLIQEIKNGITEADVVSIADLGTFYELKKLDALMKYDSPFYKDYPEDYKDPGYWAVCTAFGICMAYDEIKIDNPPEHWADLLDERWKGRIGLEDINTAGSQYAQYYMLREKLGKDFWKKLLSQQEPKIYYRTEDLANALLDGEIDVAGEFSIYTVYNYKIVKKAPIKGVYPEEGIPFVLTPVAIMKKTKHPEEAEKFLDFLLSPKGQKIIQRLSYEYSVRSDILPLEEKEPLDELSILRPENPLEYAKKRNEYIREFNDFLKGNK